VRKFRSLEVMKWGSEEVKVTNLKRNSSLTAVNRCKNPNLQKRLGISFCTFQVLKWRSGLTRVVSTYTYAVPLSTTSVPTPSKHSHPVTTITRKNTTQCPEVVSTYTYAVSLSAISTHYPLQSISTHPDPTTLRSYSRWFQPTHMPSPYPQ